MSDSSLEKSQLAETALSDETALVSLVENLSSSSRMTRQSSASALSLVADKDASLLSSHISAFVDALNRPEAQTRWEVLDILTKLVGFRSLASCRHAFSLQGGGHYGAEEPEGLAARGRSHPVLPR